MRDLVEDLAAVHRAVARDVEGGDEVARVTMRRTYATDPADLWSALTEPERIVRWFLPISGDLRRAGASSSKATRAATSWRASPRRGCGRPSVARRAS